MSVVTDSLGLEDPKDPTTCNVFALLKLFRSEEQLAELADRYRAGGLGYGHVKLNFDKINAHFAPTREKRKELVNNMDYVESILQKGAEKFVQQRLQFWKKREKRLVCDKRFLNG